MLTDLLFRLRVLLRRHRVEQDLDDELQAHLAHQAAVYRKAGLSADDAARRARVELGGVEQVKEACRDARGTRWLEDVVQDLRFAYRLFVKYPAFTAAAVLILGLGIGATNTIFTVANAVLLRGVQSDPPGRLLSLSTHVPDQDDVDVSYLDFMDWRDATQSFEGVAAFTNERFTLADPELPVAQLLGAAVSANGFDLLRESPALGRRFIADDDRLGAAPVVMLGHRMWTDRYDADPEAVGRTVRLDGRLATIIGVMPEGFGFPQSGELWVPLGQTAAVNAQRDARDLQVFGRLADGSGRGSATAELHAIAARLEEAHPDTNDGVTVSVSLLRPGIGPWHGLLFTALMAAVGILLLIACANVANLMLARAIQRQHEVSLRVSLGSTRWRIVRQLLTEALVLSFLGGVAGWALSVLGVRLFTTAVAPFGAPYWFQFTMDTRVLWFLVAACLGTPVVFGLAPALHVSRAGVITRFRPEGLGHTAGLRARRWTGTLVVAELALTLVLLAGAGLMTRSYLALQQADEIVDVGALLTMSLDLPETYTSSEQRRRAYRELETRLEAAPGVTGATFASRRPFVDGLWRQLEIEGRPARPRERPRVPTVSIGSRYFETLGPGVIRGRAFIDTDGLSGRHHVIVNRLFAARFFAGQEVLGRRLKLWGDDPGVEVPWATVVGVAPAIRQRYLAGPGPVVYLPYTAQPPPGGVLMVSTEQEPATLAQTVRRVVGSFDPNAPLSSVQTMTEWSTSVQWPHRIFGGLFAIFAGIALGLSATGLYAVTAHAVSQRTREIGVRMALGAATRHVWPLVLRRSLTQLVVGLGLGLLGALSVGRLLPLVFQETATDPITLVLITALLAAVTLAACFGPARRATAVDPAVALRRE